ncbi:hypothetical protein CALVIDRAFT_391364 [Calocera viscosa TUFC12733]|uniref:HNH nuclease domain-containing protein n=1 Tax=Calocera viscosa (strain TUFC12733) TaxID=1330018 RepID=A0A167GHF9_CALVF|nr:hypothetical protein CALVIDRAFT_391364 [Calocera viscosa TUFC12733]
MQREMNCAFSGARGDMGCEAMHIVPHRIGDNWLDLLWDTRAWDTAGETRPRSIDALENGFLVSASIHAAYEKCKLAIIATPNKVLGTDDVPPRRERTFPFHVPTGMEYPDNQLRYTLQWMGASDQVISANNVDAAFNSDRLEDIEMPSPALVNYSYAYRALQAFGKTNAKYRSRPGVKRPPPPSPPRLGPSRTVNNRLTMLKKRAASQAAAASPPAAQSPPSPAPLPGAGSELADDDLLSIADDGTPPTSFEPRSELELSVHPEGYGGLGEGGRVDAAYIMAMLMHQTPEAKLAKSARLASIEHWRSEVSANGD